MASIRDPDGTRLLIKVDSSSNDEFEPQPLDRLSAPANGLAHEQVAEMTRHCSGVQGALTLRRQKAAPVHRG